MLCMQTNLAKGSSNSELVQLTSIDRVCPGHDFQLIYECTVCGEGGTRWTGTLFNCRTPGGILLRHTKFENDNAAGECNNGSLVAHSTGVVYTNNSRCFVSQLNVSMNTFINNKTVTCSHVDDTSETVVNTSTVNIQEGKHVLLY